MEVWENPAWLGDAIGRADSGVTVPLGLRRRSPTELVVTTDEDRPMRVVVHRQIAPGWAVRVDGEPADIVDADGFFMGVDLTAGDHTLVFEYRPRWVRPSLALSAAGLIGLGAMAAAAALGRARPGHLKSARYRADWAVQPDER
jgi:hypothetical protein